MSADLINLNRARKQKARRDEAVTAEANRIRFGRTKAEKLAADAERNKAERHIEGASSGRRSVGSMKKRSVAVAGHRTSISIEEPFWTALKIIAQSDRQSLAALIAAIDQARPGEVNLSSAIRLHVLAWYQAKVAG